MTTPSVMKTSPRPLIVVRNTVVRLPSVQRRRSRPGDFRILQTEGPGVPRRIETLLVLDLPPEAERLDVRRVVEHALALVQGPPERARVAHGRYDVRR